MSNPEYGGEDPDSRRTRHAQQKAANVAALVARGIRYDERNGGEHLILSIAGFPRVDLWPSTGRWRVTGYPHTRGGGAEKMLPWIEKQRASRRGAP